MAEPDVATNGAIAVAMSGGVDSSVAAALLRQAGRPLVGVTMLLYKPDEKPGGDAVDRARAVADALGITHYVLDCAREFEQLVLLPAWQEYAAGRTPSPCLRCNRRVKLGLLWEWAQRQGAERIATGHYARLERDASGPMALRRGCDEGKDQSYFLASLLPAQLERALFPVGHMRKSEVRALARRLGLPTAETPESQDACLVAPGESFADKLRVRFAAPARRGEIVDEAGRVVGQHEGIHLFTVGQRKGLPAGATARRWVKALSAESGRILVTSDPEAILGTRFVVNEVNWLVGETPTGPLACAVQIRYRHPSAPATVHPAPDGSLLVTLDRPAKAITPGQAAVFYDGDRVLGQGWIGSLMPTDR